MSAPANYACEGVEQDGKRFLKVLFGEKELEMADSSCRSHGLVRVQPRPNLVLARGEFTAWQM